MHKVCNMFFQPPVPAQGGSGSLLHWLEKDSRGQAWRARHAHPIPAAQYLEPLPLATAETHTTCMGGYLSQMPHLMTCHIKTSFMLCCHLVSGHWLRITVSACHDDVITIMPRQQQGNDHMHGQGKVDSRHKITAGHPSIHV